MKRQTPHLCYCQIPEETLKELARRRFVEGVPTEVLMQRMKTQKEKEYLAAVSLLDVKPVDLAHAVPDAEPGLLRHLFDCRFHVKNLLEDEGIHIEEKDVS